MVCFFVNILVSCFVVYRLSIYTTSITKVNASALTYFTTCTDVTQAKADIHCITHALANDEVNRVVFFYCYTSFITARCSCTVSYFTL